MSRSSDLHFLRVWLALGLQSFGGGMATLTLIRRAAVEQEQWITGEEFARFWSLVQLAPGINLLALTTLIGRKVGAAKGICLALLGLLLPSVGITVLLTVCYTRIQHAPIVHAVLSGVIPAIVGLGLVTAWQIARPPLEQSQRAGRGSVGLSLLLLLGSSLAARLGHLPVLVILGGAGALYALWSTWENRRSGRAH